MVLESLFFAAEPYLGPPSRERRADLTCRAALGYELDGPDISPQTFPLPTLSRTFEALAAELHDGQGFSIISGLNPDLYSAEDNALVFLGLSSYVGSERGMQDNKGRMMGGLKSTCRSKLWHEF